MNLLGAAVETLIINGKVATSLSLGAALSNSVIRKFRNPVLLVGIFKVRTP